MKQAACIALVLGLAAASTPVAAETVRIRTGSDSFGQGWLFLDSTGRCLVATPAHVVMADGRLTGAILIDPKGRESALSDVARPDPDVDVAFLTVSGETAREGCSASRVSHLTLDFVLRGLAEALLTTAADGERVTIRVRPRAATIDRDRGGVIAFAPINPSEALTRGMSGSAIATSDRPLAMLIEVSPESGLGLALRFDVIGRLATRYRPAPPPPGPTPLDGATVTLITGTVSDPERTPGDILKPGRFLTAGAVRGRLVLVVRFDRPRTIRVLRLDAADLASAYRLRRATLETSGVDGASFTPARSCDATRRQRPAFDCAIAPRTVAAARLQIEITEPGDVGLANLVFD